MWDLLVMILAMANSFLAPIDIAFEPEFTKNQQYLWMMNSVDIVFFLDMIIISLTTFTDSHGAEIRDNKKIMLRYVFSLSFLPDLLSLLGNSFFSILLSKLHTLVLFKVVRVAKLG